MLRSFRRSVVLSAVGLCAVLAGPLASAQASNATIRATISSYSSRIARDEAGVLRGVAAFKKHHAPVLVRALRHEVGDLNSLRGKLTRESASSARGRRGKSDVVAGLGLIASAYGALARDVAAASKSMGVSQAKVRAAVAADNRGRAKLRAGLKLLS